MTAPAHTYAVRPADAGGEHRWQLDLPSDPAAAAEYLRGIERAREIELEAIRRLRRRIEGDHLPLLATAPGRRTAAAVAALVALGLAVLLWPQGGGAPKAATAGAPANTAAVGSHDGHAAAGSGIAVTITGTGPAAAQTHAQNGVRTLVLRNETDAAASVAMLRAGAATSNVGAAKLRSRAVGESPAVAPGERVEWTISLDTGTYALHSLQGDSVSDGARLVVH